MDARKLTGLRADLTSFLDDVAGTMGNPRRRRWCDAYLRGVLLDGHRKSVEPMAARLQLIEQGSEDYEQALQQFLNQSPWDEQTVQEKPRKRDEQPCFLGEVYQPTTLAYSCIHCERIPGVVNRSRYSVNEV